MGAGFLRQLVFVKDQFDFGDPPELSSELAQWVEGVSVGPEVLKSI